MSDLRDLRDIAPGPPPKETGPLDRPVRLPKPPKGLNKRNPERAAKNFAKCYGVCSRMVREPDFSRCVVPACGRRDIQVAHVRSRGASGVDWANVVALCPDHHYEQGAQGIVTFQQTYEINLEQLAGEVAQAVLVHRCAGRLDHMDRCRVCREGPHA